MFVGSPRPLNHYNSNIKWYRWGNLMLQKYKRVLKILLLFLPLIGILIYKYLTLAISIGDTNVYFYDAYQLLQGKELYKDVLFTNLPLFPLISVLYFLLTKGNIYLYYFTTAVESFILSILIYYAVFLETRKFLPSFISSLLFIFSVYNLVNSSFQTGIFTASIFAIGSYISIRKKKTFLAGLFISLCFLTKAYFIPILVALMFLSLITFKKKQLIKWFGGLLVGILPLLPFLISSFSEMSRYLLGFSVQRGTGIDKFQEAKTFLSFDILLTLLLPLMLLYKKYNRMFWIILLTLFSLFFFIFADFYYLYSGMIIPFLCIRAGHLTNCAFSQIKKENVKFLVPIFLPAIILFNILQYSDSADALKVYSIDEIVSDVKKINPEYVYGREISLAVSYLTNKPFIEGVIDTNPLLFMSGFLDKDKITEEVISKKTVVITNGFDYPGQTGTALNDIVNTEVFNKHCGQVSSYPVIARPPTNRVILLNCPGKIAP